MKIVVTSNTSKISQRYRNMARNLPGIVDGAIRDLVTNEAVPLFQATTRTWKHQPAFIPSPTVRGWKIDTNSQIYQWVDQGTRPHIISAKNAPFLTFRYPYQAATKPRWISSRQAALGKNWARKKSVNHPGTEARNFTDEIMKRIQTRAANKVREALNQASYGMGAGL